MFRIHIKDNNYITILITVILKF